jgi:hypothetical protein
MWGMCAAMISWAGAVRLDAGEHVTPWAWVAVGGLVVVAALTYWWDVVWRVLHPPMWVDPATLPRSSTGARSSGGCGPTGRPHWLHSDCRLCHLGPQDALLVDDTYNHRSPPTVRSPRAGGGAAAPWLPQSP